MRTPQGLANSLRRGIVFALAVLAPVRAHAALTAESGDFAIDTRVVEQGASAAMASNLFRIDTRGLMGIATASAGSGIFPIDTKLAAPDGEVQLASYQSIVTLEHFRFPWLMAAFDGSQSVCADGSQATTLVFAPYSGDANPAHYQFSFADAAGLTTADTGSFTISYASTGEFAGKLTARHRHPTRMTLDNLSRDLSLRLTYTPAGREISRKAWKILRAPVVFVHGIWSGPDAWTSIIARMDGATDPPGRWPVAIMDTVNYFQTNAAPFATNYPKVGSTINALLTRLRQHGISAGRVDVVGHSMGGILARLYIQSPEYPGTIRRMITLNTPHSGTQFANYLLTGWPGAARARWILDAVGKKVDAGAVNDARVDSTAVDGTLNKPNARAVPSRAVITITSSLLPCGPLPPMLNNAGELDGYSARPAGPALLDAVFHDGNDLIVAASSQRGGLDSSFTTTIGGQCHTGSAGAASVQDAVINALDILETNTAFWSSTGYHPLNLSYTLPGPPRGSSGLGVEGATPGEIIFDSPAAGTRLDSGSSIQVTVHAVVPVDRYQLVAGVPGKEDFTILDSATTGTATFTYVAPEGYAGDVTLHAAGYTTETLVAEGELRLRVGPPGALASLSIIPEAIAMPLGQSVGLKVMGTLGDGSEIDMTSDPALVFGCEDASVASMGEPGVLQSFAEGVTVLTVAVAGKWAQAPVEVLPPNAWDTVVDPVARVVEILLGRLASTVEDDLNGDGVVDVADLLKATLP